MKKLSCRTGRIKILHAMHLFSLYFIMNKLLMFVNSVNTCFRSKRSRVPIREIWTFKTPIFWSIDWLDIDMQVFGRLIFLVAVYVETFFFFLLVLQSSQDTSNTVCLRWRSRDQSSLRPLHAPWPRSPRSPHPAHRRGHGHQRCGRHGKHVGL